jgi:hypothetical protein
MRRGIRRAYHRQPEQKSQPERLENETGEPLNPIVGWSIALLISVGVWWCLWLTITSLV